MEGVKNIEVTKARILDFFLAFPAEIRTIRLPPALAGKKKIANSLINIYRDPLSTTQVFRDMEHIQMAAIQALAASNIINSERLTQGFIERTSVILPDDIQRHVLQNIAKDPLMLFIVNDLSAIPLLGLDGLKHRTGLMEYRYDNA
jgi:hypothetical protein